MGDREALRRLSEERVALPAGFEIAPEVWDEVVRTGLPLKLGNDGVERWHCPKCDQGLILARKDGHRYRYQPGEMESLILSHFIQAHNWSREAVGD